MSAKDIDRYGVLQRFIHKEIKRKKVAELLGISIRHVKRLKQKVIVAGPAGLLHAALGKPSHNGVPKKERTKIEALLRAKYPDFTPTFAAEKLRELHGVDRDPKTVRRIMIDLQLWQQKKRRAGETHRSWRLRKECCGEMLQFDGSYHDWFEGRGGITESCLLAAIDDATGKITKAIFAEHEGVFPVFRFWKAYMETHGKPRSIYLDKFSTYKMNQRVAKENHDLKTQFERAMQELGVQPITAHSPEAKGRIERLFLTLQDRLVKELRLKNIITVPEANRFLETEFIPAFNARFSVISVSPANLHRKLTVAERERLPSIFSRQEERTVRNDFTFSFKTQWYQILKDQRITVCKKDVVTIEEHLDGTLHVRLRGKELNYLVLPKRPKKAAVPFVIAATAPASWKPAPDHPWRKRGRVAILRTHS